MLVAALLCAHAGRPPRLMHHRRVHRLVVVPQPQPRILILAVQNIDSHVERGSGALVPAHTKVQRTRAGGKILVVGGHGDRFPAYALGQPGRVDKRGARPRRRHEQVRVAGAGGHRDSDVVIVVVLML